MWWARELYQRFSNDRVLSISAGVTFYVLLAIFPAIAACVSLFSLFENFSRVDADLRDLSALLPGGAIHVITGQIRAVMARGHRVLSFAAVFGFIFSLWSANSGVVALFDALNIVRREKETRSIFVLYGVSFLFTLGLLIAAGAAGAGLIWISSWIHVDNSFLSSVGFCVGLITLWGCLDLVIALLYRVGPTGDDTSWHWVTWGSGIASLAWLCFSAAFSWYAANFGSFDKTYGPLGAMAGFMIWIWLSVVVLLVGEEINEVIDCHRKAKTLAPHPLPEKAVR